MAFLEHHPLYIRKKIALLITVGVALALVIIFVLIYSRKQTQGTPEPSSRLNNFYNTILDSGQSYFERK
jgi:predicted PurR-regulated permease PerM